LSPLKEGGLPTKEGISKSERRAGHFNHSALAVRQRMELGLACSWGNWLEKRKTEALPIYEQENVGTKTKKMLCH